MDVLLNILFAFGISFQEKLTSIQYLDGNPRFCYLDGRWNKDNSAGYLKDIQFPVK